jgi:hypothetical protein
MNATLREVVGLRGDPGAHGLARFEGGCFPQLVDGTELATLREGDRKVVRAFGSTSPELRGSP